MHLQLAVFVEFCEAGSRGKCRDPKATRRPRQRKRFRSYFIPQPRPPQPRNYLQVRDHIGASILVSSFISISVPPLLVKRFVA